MCGSLLAPFSAHGFEFGLRPSLQDINYIHAEAVDGSSRDFVALIATAIQRADVVQAAAARWQAETIGIEASIGEELPSGALYGQIGAANGKSQKPYSYGVRVSVPIFDGFSAANATAAQRATSEASHHAALDELAATLVDLVAAAAAIRRETETLAIRQTQLKVAKELLAAIANEEKAGLASKVDRDQVESQLAQIRIDIKSADSARLEAMESFAKIAGAAPSRVGAIGSIADELPPNADAGLEVALAENPQLAQQIGLADAAALKTKSLEGSLGPAVSLDLSAGVTGDFDNAVAEATDLRAALKLEVPLAFGRDASVCKSALNAQAAAFEVNAAVNGVTAGLRSAYKRLDNTRASLKLANEALERARTVRTGMAVERTLGQRSIFEILSAQKAFAEAQIQVLGVRYDLTVAEHLLAAQLGRLDDIYGVTLR